MESMEKSLPCSLFSGQCDVWSWRVWRTVYHVVCFQGNVMFGHGGYGEQFTMLFVFRAV